MEVLRMGELLSICSFREIPVNVQAPLVSEYPVKVHASARCAGAQHRSAPGSRGSGEEMAGERYFALITGKLSVSAGGEV
ncbi:hypothetical protein GCM10011359_02990 [Nesterenkonia alkaliphila]|nr:hypothetical protein GCM10011359_02990 [Nesterenkonia alkaliphila]